MITRVNNLTDEQIDKIRKMIGEAFVSNELFHNWGTEEERREDVLKYMSLYVDYVYQAGELYSNDDMTGFIGLEDSGNKPVWPQIIMLFKMLTKIKYFRIKSLMNFVKQISKANDNYSKMRHIDALMVCVDKNCQGQGIASELIRYAQNMADETGVPLLFDTDMKPYAEMYQHFGCEMYNTVTADNGVTRYCLCYKK